MSQAISLTDDGIPTIRKESTATDEVVASGARATRP
jgi:hypothetical protein